MKKEQETIKEERPQHEIELEQEPSPKEGESLDVWLQRIGGPNVLLVKDAKETAEAFKSFPRKKIDKPLFVNSDGTFILNDENIVKYFGEKGKKQIDGRNLFNEKTKEYQIGKELWGGPDDYRGIIIKLLKENHKLVADKRFGESVKKWVEESEKEKEEKEEKIPSAFEGEFDAEDFEEEEPETKEEPELSPEGETPTDIGAEKEVKKEQEKEVKEAAPERGEPRPEKSGREKKPLTLDEEIKQKEKELEKIEQGYNIYYSPVVQSLMGLHYKSEFKRLKKEVKKLKKTSKKAGRDVPEAEETPAQAEIPTKVEKEPTTEEQFKATEKKLKSVYGKIRTRNRKIREGGVLGRADLEKEVGILEKERNKLKEIKKKIKERLKIQKRLKEIPKEIKKGGVIKQTKLEGEQKKLEKRLKKFK